MDKKRREGIPSKNYLLFIQKENKSIACFLCYKLIIRGEDEMGPALMRIMEPELCKAKEQGIEEGIEKGIEKGIYGAVDILKSLGLGRSEIKKAVMERYHLTEKETEKYL